VAGSRRNLKYEANRSVDRKEERWMTRLFTNCLTRKLIERSNNGMMKPFLATRLSVQNRFLRWNRWAARRGRTPFSVWTPGRVLILAVMLSLLPSAAFAVDARLAADTYTNSI